VTRAVIDQALFHGGPDPPLKGGDQGRTGPPDDVKPGHGVAVAVGEVPSPLRPGDDREKADPVLHKPRALFPRRKVHICLRPFDRPIILVLLPVKARGAHPVLPGQLPGILDPQPPLFGRIHQKQPAEGPPGLSAQRRLRFLIQQEHLPPRIGQLGGGHQSGQAGSHHDDVRIHRVHPPQFFVYV